MSTIQAKIIDRVITFTERPLLYSHAKNVDYIHVTFDDEWTGYTKTAVFYRDINKPYAVLMDDDTATIPPEVMETDGKIYMGVFGVKDDEVLNSEVVFYPVGVGALTEGAMPEVTPDLWQDIISRIEEIKETGANIGPYVETATEAAQTATTKAQEASTSASTATTAATNAQRYAEDAEDAKTGAESAKADAVQAKTDAETAKTQAQTAKAGAESAMTDAETCKTQAESARDAAQGYANSANSAKTQAQTAKTQAVNAKNEAVNAANNAAAEVEENVSVLETATGEAVTVDDSAQDILYGLKLYGKSVQDGTPSPENPVPIESVEDVTVSVYGENLFDKSKCTNKGGMTVTQNADGSITVSGTPANAYANVCDYRMRLPAGTYKVASNNDKSGIYLQVTANGENFINRTFTLSAPTVAIIKVQNGMSVDPVDVTLRPYLIRGSAEPESVPQYVDVQTLATALNLYAVPVTSGGNYTDEDGQQWIADVADFGTGKITRNVIAKTFNGTETIYINSNDTLMIRDYDFMGITIQNQNTLIGIISNMFVANTWVKVDQNNDPQIALAWGSGVGFKMPGIDTTQDFKTFLSTNNLHVVGLRNTPTTEDIPANIMQAYKNLHTNEGTTNVFADSDPQAGIELSYRNNRQLADNVVEVVSKKASSAPVTSVNGKTGDVVLTIDDLNIEDVTEPLYEDISSLENGYANSVLSAREISTWTSLDSWLGDGMEDAKKMRGVWRFGATGSLSGLPTQIDNGSMLHMYITGTNTLVLYFYAKDGIYRRNVSWMGSVWDTSTSEWVQIANNNGETVDEHTTQLLEIETELNTVWARQVLYGEISPKTFTAAGVSLWDIPIADAYHGKSALVELVGMMIDTDGSASVEMCQYAGATEKQPFSTRDFSAGAGIGYSTIKRIKIDDDTTGIRIKGIVGSTSQMGRIRSGSYCYVKITILNS